jgi:hypothetical protein
MSYGVDSRLVLSLTFSALLHLKFLVDLTAWNLLVEYLVYYSYFILSSHFHHYSHNIRINLALYLGKKLLFPFFNYLSVILCSLRTHGWYKASYGVIRSLGRHYMHPDCILLSMKSISCSSNGFIKLCIPFKS